MNDHRLLFKLKDSRVTCTIRAPDIIQYTPLHRATRFIEPPFRLMGSKFHTIYRTELQFDSKYFQLIDFSALIFGITIYIYIYIHTMILLFLL